jgi:hypothetical protein
LIVDEGHQAMDDLAGVGVDMANDPNAREDEGLATFGEFVDGKAAELSGRPSRGAAASAS